MQELDASVRGRELPVHGLAQGVAVAQVAACGLRCRAVSIPSRTRAWRARDTVMAVTPTASAVRSSVQAGPSGPWSQSSQIWARCRGSVLGEPEATSLFQVRSFLG